MAHSAQRARRSVHGRPSRVRSGLARPATGGRGGTRAAVTRPVSTRPAGRVAAGQVSRRLRHAGRWLAGNAVFGLLALAALATLAALGLAARGAPAGAASTAPGAGPTGPAGPAAPVWIPLRAQTAPAILAAVRASPLFHVHRADPGDHLRDVSRLGAPVLVTELPGPGGATPQDAYVVPIHDAHGGTVGVAVAWLTPDHAAVYVGYLRTYDVSVPAWPWALPGAGRVAAAVAARAPGGWRPGAAPRLVYFPVAPRARDAGPGRWTGGGAGPDDPVWLVAGADGRALVLGTDGRVYPLSALPVAAPA